MERYNVLKYIGRGQFGVVHLAERKSDGLLVCLKELLLKTDEDRVSVRKEASILQKLDKHPFIVSLLDQFETNDHFYLVLEYCAGGDLSQELQKAKERQRYFAERQVLRWTAQLVEALRFLHDNDIIHRDVKPGNVLLTADGEIRLTDFGVARQTTNDEAEMTQLAGTPLYWSPEQVSGQNYSFASDIWSLGCVVFELCALMPAFGAKSIPAAVLKISEGKYGRLPPCYSTTIHSIVSSCLRINPEARPDAASLAQSPEIGQFVQDVCREFQVAPHKPRQVRRQSTPVTAPPSPPRRTPQRYETQSPPETPVTALSGVGDSWCDQRLSELDDMARVLHGKAGEQTLQRVVSDVPWQQPASPLPVEPVRGRVSGSSPSRQPVSPTQSSPAAPVSPQVQTPPKKTPPKKMSKAALLKKKQAESREHELEYKRRIQRAGAEGQSDGALREAAREFGKRASQAPDQVQAGGGIMLIL